MKKFDGIRHPFINGVLMTLLLTAVYLIIAIPFKVMEIIPGFTDIRPVLSLQPIYGIFFGLPGCFASAIGNLICDAVSDSIRWSSIGGFIANFLGPFIFFVFWTFITKNEFNLKKAKNILFYFAAVIISALVQTAIITPMVKLIYPEIYGSLFALTVIINNTLFPIFFGIPTIILMQEELGLKTYRQKRITAKG